MEWYVTIIGKSLQKNPGKPLCSLVVTDGPWVQIEANFLVSSNLSLCPWNKAALIVEALELQLSVLNKLVVKRNLVCLVVLWSRHWIKQIICSCTEISVKSSTSSTKLMAAWTSDRKELQTASLYASIIPFVLWLLCWKSLISSSLAMLQAR